MRTLPLALVVDCASRQLAANRVNVDLGAKRGLTVLTGGFVLYRAQTIGRPGSLAAATEQPAGLTVQRLAAGFERLLLTSQLDAARTSGIDAEHVRRALAGMATTAPAASRGFAGDQIVHATIAAAGDDLQSGRAICHPQRAAPGQRALAINANQLRPITGRLGATTNGPTLPIELRRTLDHRSLTRAINAARQWNLVIAGIADCKSSEIGQASGHRDTDVAQSPIDASEISDGPRICSPLIGNSTVAQGAVNANLPTFRSCPLVKQTAAINDPLRRTAAGRHKAQ